MFCFFGTVFILWIIATLCLIGLVSVFSPNEAVILKKQAIDSGNAHYGVNPQTGKTELLWKVTK